jgi:4-amino-4-deoxy-L-arabinose transferase-like glycosyltransferase
LNYRLRIPDWILLLAFCAFFFLWRVASFGLIGADEPRYAQVAREMLTRHDWITPTLGGVPWMEKPPLYYWQTMVAYRVFGASDWAARLPSVVDATVLVFAAYCFLRRFRPGCAFDGALMLATSAAVVGYARAASMDMPLAATFGVAMLAWYAWLESGKRRFLGVFYASLALAMLAKGPVAPFLAALIVTVFAATQGSWRILRESLWVPGFVLFLGLAFPWYLLVQQRNPQFLHVFVLEHNLARFGTNVFHHPEPFWYFVPVTLLGWIPWAVFAVAAAGYAIRKFRQRDGDAVNNFLALWVGVFVVFFSISKSKLPGYILPAIAPGILLLANYLRERRSRSLQAAVIAVHGVMVTALIFATLILPAVLQQHRVAWTHAAVMPMSAAVVAGLLVSLALRKQGTAVLHAAGIAPAIVGLALVLRFGAPVLDQNLSARPVSRELSRLSTRQLPVAVALVPRELEFGLHFYRNQAIPRYELGQAPAGEHLVVARQGSQKAIAENLPRRRVVYLGSFPAQKLEMFYVSR